MRRLLLAAVALALLLAPAGIAAQVPGSAAGDDCPIGFVCAEYKGHVFEISKAKGAIQGFVWTLSETTTESLDGTETEQSGTAVWFVASGGAYVVTAEDVPITEAQAEVAELADPLVGVLAVAH